MEETQSGKLTRKMNEHPELAAGIAAFVGALGYGAYKYKHRGDMSTSFFLVQLRVAAQGMVVGALCVGIVFSAGKRILGHLSSNVDK